MKINASNAEQYQDEEHKSDPDSRENKSGGIQTGRGPDI